VTPPPDGIVALFSCAEGQQAYEHPDLRHGVFFHHLLEGWNGSADDGNTELTLDELVAYAKSHTREFVLRELAAAQTPRQQGSYSGEWILRLTNPRSLTNTLGMQFKLIDAGEFLMGNGETGRQMADAGLVPFAGDSSDDERPRHRVRMTQPFYLATREVTVGQFQKFVEATGHVTDGETDPLGGWGYDSTQGDMVQGRQYNWRSLGWPQNEVHPVLNITWRDANRFCQWLSEEEEAKYRLPTEAEWEYACRAGTSTRFFTGNDPLSLSGYANVLDEAMAAYDQRVSNSYGPALPINDGRVFTSRVSIYQPNAWGLYDMHGNAFEWCFDAYDPEVYQARAGGATDPKVTSSPAGKRVVRGGSWLYGAYYNRASDRFGADPAQRYNSTGFRVARTP
jgi:sulfatase modifying factor 1